MSSHTVLNKSRHSRHGLPAREEKEKLQNQMAPGSWEEVRELQPCDGCPVSQLQRNCKTCDVCPGFRETANPDVVLSQKL
ncbi:hypothetical protein AVEN_272444-1 [Araneus ventricosus]|uniref:Uncharacterized protein n=1 Tax=Araneus ventricosus TaxID=182803 RepID=A0A4Y2B0G2_ARAVE|nr:hypothetical protein AVEN_272444-1 [Araneus ventricosus]